MPPILSRQTTVSNEVPLGHRRRFGFGQHASGKYATDDSPANTETTARNRRSRWGSEAKTEFPGLPTAISANGVSQKQLDTYATHLRLEEINRKLRLNDFVPPERERSPSPPPTYDSQGRRTNMPQVRYRKKLEDERSRLVERALRNDPSFRPPVDYQQQKRHSEKVYIPVKEFPEVNFFGQLVGPRGNSLKKMERETGAKISIRGRGSVMEGKPRSAQYDEDADEDLHCLITADSKDKVGACIKLVNQVIQTAASTPESQIIQKIQQLRELAAICGTLRDDEAVCTNCGAAGHRKYDCPEARNFTASIVCRTCGGAGHMARDCTTSQGGSNATSAFDVEYASLMAELGESTDPTKPTADNAIATGASVPPWRRPEAWPTIVLPQRYSWGQWGGYQSHPPLY